MSSSGPPWPGSVPAPPPPPPRVSTPDDERYLLEADVMRRRQLRSALLHGSGRSWRQQDAVWPAVVLGCVVVAVVVALLVVLRAYEHEEDRSGPPVPVATAPTEWSTS